MALISGGRPSVSGPEDPAGRQVCRITGHALSRIPEVRGGQDQRSRPRVSVAVPNFPEDPRGRTRRPGEGRPASDHLGPDHSAVMVRGAISSMTRGVPVSVRIAVDGAPSIRPPGSSPRVPGSRQDRSDDLARGVGQAVVAAVVGEGQPGVVEAQQVEDRGVQVVDVDAGRPRRGGRRRRSRRGPCPP